MSSTDGCRPPRRAAQCGEAARSREDAGRASRRRDGGGDRVEIEIEIEMASRRGGGRRGEPGEGAKPIGSTSSEIGSRPPRRAPASRADDGAGLSAGRAHGGGSLAETRLGEGVLGGARRGGGGSRVGRGVTPLRDGRVRSALCTVRTRQPHRRVGLSRLAPSRRNTSGSRMSSTRETMPPASRTPTPTQTQTLTLTLTETRPPASRAARRLQPHRHHRPNRSSAHPHTRTLTPTLTPPPSPQPSRLPSPGERPPQGPNEPIHRHAIPPEAKLARAATATRRRRRARRG